MVEVIKGVYCLTAPSGKRYVGVSVSKRGIESRWQEYRGLYKCVEKQTKLFNALKKYGPENFKYEVVLKTENVERALIVEEQLIALWNLTNNSYGYNCCSSSRMDYDTYVLKVKRLTQASKGRTISEETRRKLREGRKGRITLEETRKKMSNSQTGKVHSVETRKKIGASNKGKIISVDTRKKMSEGRKGIKMSVETRKKMSESRKGIKFSEETRKKLSESAKRRGIINEERRKINEEHCTNRQLTVEADGSLEAQNATA